MSPATLLSTLAVTALVSLGTAGVLLVTKSAAPQLSAHVAFALGVMPLILAAMTYFVPVLTRSSAPGNAAWWPPLLAWLGGMLTVGAFASDFSSALLGMGAVLGGIAALGLGAWTLNRARNMFGPRHRGLDWYRAALGFLLVALLAVLLMPLFPAQRTALRLFHLHANLLGFVGLTALGTLQVLLPTCLGKADPDAALRLQRELKWVAAGTLLIAVGASWPIPEVGATTGALVAAAGAVIYGFIVLRLLAAWQARFGRTLSRMHGAAPSLVAAAMGLASLIAAGVAHGFGWLPARPAVAGFVVAFLLPLVSGAAAQLLPVWLRPGKQGEWHHVLRARLCRWGGVRGMALLLLGLALAVA